MNKNMIKLFALFLVPVLLLTACAGGGSSPPSKVETKIMRVSNNQPTIHPLNVALESFKKEVEAKTNGAITVSVFPNSSLGDDTTNIDQVQLGAIESAFTMGSLSTLVIGTKDPRAVFEELPFLFADSQAARKAWDGALGEQFTELATEKGLKVLCYWENGFRNFTNNIRPIITPKDMKGIKFRIANSEMRKIIFKALNATAIPMAFAELFTALQQGTIDGQENPLSIIETSKFYDVQKYLSLSRYIYNTATFYVNPAWFKSLTAEQQTIIQKASENARDYMRQLNDEFEATSLKDLADKGMKINEIDHKAFVSAVQPVYDYYISNYPGGQELINLALSGK